MGIKYGSCRNDTNDSTASSEVKSYETLSLSSNGSDIPMCLLNSDNMVGEREKERR